METEVMCNKFAENNLNILIENIEVQHIETYLVDRYFTFGASVGTCKKISKQIGGLSIINTYLYSGVLRFNYWEFRIKIFLFSSTPTYLTSKEKVFSLQEE